MNKNFNPELLEDMAAWLFWTQTLRDGFTRTLKKVLQTQGQSVLNCADSKEIFSRYPLEDMSEAEFSALHNAIAEHAYLRAANQENLVGMIFVNDG